MNTTPKTDECIKMLGEAQIAFAPLHYVNDGYFDKNRCLDFQNRIKAMLAYRLMPLCTISIPDDADKETVRANPLLQNIRNFDAFWYAMKNYPSITADDLKNEFWGLCPDLESMPQYLDAMNVKFDNVNYRYDTDIDVITGHCEGLKQLVEMGTISQQEADEILWNIHFIAKRYNSIIEYIAAIYKEFRAMAKPQSESTNKPQQAPPIHKQLTTDRAKQLFERAVKVGFIDAADHHKWNESDDLLSYFAWKASAYLVLNHSKEERATGKNKTQTITRTSWRPFEMWFGLPKDTLKGRKNNCEHQTNKVWPPSGYEKIDKLFG